MVSPWYLQLKGDKRLSEPWLYSECLQRNIAVRARAWREAGVQLRLRYDDQLKTALTSPTI